VGWHSGVSTVSSRPVNAGDPGALRGAYGNCCKKRFVVINNCLQAGPLNRKLPQH